MRGATTDPTGWQLSEEQLRAWLDGLLGVGTAVFAPVAVDGVLLSGRIRSSDQVVLRSSEKTRWSPKEHVFPRSEAVYRYRADGGTVSLEDPPAIGTQQILLGVRPCDAAGLVRLDEIFLSGHADVQYADRRALTTVVSVVCTDPAPECFCTAVGGSPVSREGSDVQLVPLDEGWLVVALTGRGEELTGAAGGQWKAVPEGGVTARLEEIEGHASTLVGRLAVREDWAQLLEGAFDHVVWERLAATCLGCGVCAYICPSCSCFDMNHEATVWCGEQCRSWDSCSFPLFTRHASGHNPRSTRSDRYRQRVLHKFAYHTGGGAPFRCVGCGRCITWCPAGLDIHETVAATVAALREEGRDDDG